MKDYYEEKQAAETNSFPSFLGSPKIFVAEPTDESSKKSGNPRRGRNRSSFHFADSKNTTFIHSHNASDTPFQNILLESGENKSTKRSLSRLKEKFYKITEEIDTGRETGRETVRELKKFYKENSEIINERSVFYDEEFKACNELRWCAYCKGEIATEVSYKNSSKTLFSSIGIFLAGGIFGCFLLPYVGTACKRGTLICHICKREVGEEILN